MVEESTNYFSNLSVENLDATPILLGDYVSFSMLQYEHVKQLMLGKEVICMYLDEHDVESILTIKTTLLVD